MSFMRMKDIINWSLHRKMENYQIYHPKINNKKVYFKIEMIMPHPVELVQEYVLVQGKNLDKRLIWAYQNYDDVRVVKEF